MWESGNAHPNSVLYTSDHFQSGTNINAVPACMQYILTVHAAVLHAYNIHVHAVLHVADLVV